MGKKQKTEREKNKKKERLNDGNNNGQGTHGARRPAWRTQAAWAKIFSKTYSENASGRKKSEINILVKFPVAVFGKF